MSGTIETVLVLALAAIIAFGALTRWSGYLEVERAIVAAKQMNRAAGEFAQVRRCDASGGTVTADLSDLTSDGYVRSPSEVNLGGQIDWSVSVSSVGVANVTATTSEVLFRRAIASEMNGRISGNSVSFTPVRLSVTGDDSAAREVVNLAGGICI